MLNSQAAIAKALEMLQQGYSQAAIALEVQRSPGWVSKVKSAAGMTAPRNVPRPEGSQTKSAAYQRRWQQRLKDQITLGQGS